MARAATARATPAHTGLPAFISLDPRRLSLAEGFRAALSTAAIVALNEWLHWPPVMVAGLAAWLTCLCDPGGPVRRRIPALLSFAIIGTALTIGFGVLRGFAPLWVVVPAAAAGVFCTSFARIWGQAVMQVGNLLTVTLVLALRTPITDIAAAAALASMFMAGSLWALLVTMVIWRLHPYLPARRAVAECYSSLATLVDDLREIAAHPEQHQSNWERHAREHRRTVRDSIESARTAVLQTVRVRGPISGRAAQSWVRLEVADQMFGSLIGLTDLLESQPEPATREAADRILRRLRPILTLLAEYTVTDKPDRLQRLERAVAAIEDTSPPGTSLHTLVARIVDRTRVAITLAAPEGLLPGTAPGDPAPSWRKRVIEPIRANLDRNSAVLRHAARVAVVSIPAFAITLHWSGPFEYWLTITLVMTMQPFFGLTFTRALERIGGTVLGGGVAAVVALICTTPISLAAALFPLAIIAFSLRQVSFGLFIAGITPTVVLLVESGQPGTSEVHVALLRALFTLIGGALAVIGCLTLWPSWEPGRLLRELRGAIAAHGKFAVAEIAALLGEAPANNVDVARRAAGMASNNVEASLQRALLEPHSSAGLEPALTVDAALRRMAGRLSALQLDPGTNHDPAIWHLWRDWIDTATTRLAEGQTDIPDRPPLPSGDRQANALVRLARQIDIAAGALKRLRVV